MTGSSSYTVHTVPWKRPHRALLCSPRRSATRVLTHMTSCFPSLCNVSTFPLYIPVCKTISRPLKPKSSPFPTSTEYSYCTLKIKYFLKTNLAMTPDNTINLAFGLSAAFFAMIGIWQAYRLSTLSAGKWQPVCLQIQLMGSQSPTILMWRCKDLCHRQVPPIASRPNSQIH